jgi:hypothetical protein
MSLIRFIEAAQSHGWHHEPSGARSETGGWTPNPAAMKELQSIAASLGMEINLEVAPMGAFKAKGKRTIETRSLIRWYKSLGFRPAWPGEGETILVWRAAE